MKKLMIALAAVAMSVAANAAALNWSTYGFINDGSVDEDWISGGQAYLVMVTDAAAFAVADDLSITGGTIVDSAAFDGGTAGNLWNTEDLAAGQTYLFAVIGTTDGAGMTVPTTGFYGVDKDGDNGTASGFFEVTWDASTGGGFEAVGEGFAMNTQVGGGEVIPEPSSALLLLLGMAGIALRRKQA